MGKAAEWVRNGLAVLAILMLGYWLGAGSAVKASSYSDNVEFQLTGVNETGSLLVYQPATKTVYVYRGVTVGNSALQCSVKFQMDKPGGVIHRLPCPLQSLNP